ncbi:MAG: deoxyhypusine synthase family protein [Deltaproteobacteria bacterium]|nr:deoxyhypusine synthase family protein [Deltaproteobacteria bacterium]
MSIRDFVNRHYRHFNAASVRQAADAYVEHLEVGGSMFLAMAGAMSTAELGLSLAEMIRQGKIHGISTTGANLEEDIFNLVAHKFYRRIPGYRYLNADDEQRLYEEHLNRVTDTCIPEEEAIRRVGGRFLEVLTRAEREQKRYFPWEYFYMLIREGLLKEHYQIDPRNSWVVAAAEKNIPIYTPGWEDSTLANGYVADVRRGKLKSLGLVKTGLEQMDHLIDWYRSSTAGCSVGFFQIGGGIAGDFPICVVPLIEQDMGEKARKWGYFCQISDSTTSYGSYSGAVPNEKITWGKLDKTTPSFVIESDASIVAPLIFQYVLERN